MAWLAVNEDGLEVIFNNQPLYCRSERCWCADDGYELDYKDFYDFSAGVERKPKYFYGVVLPKGTIKRLIGRELTLDDEPVELE